MKKFGLKLLNFLPFLFLFLAIALIVQIVVSLKNERTPTIFGYGMFLVVSPSMEDEIMTGDLIFVNTKATEFNEQDIITFHQPGEESIIITHKIVNKVSTPTGYLYTTKGVNNPESLSWEIKFSGDYIIGKYVGKSAFLGDIYHSIFSGRLNFLYAIVVIVFMMIGILEIMNIVKEVTLHKQQALLQEKDRLVAEELEKLKEKSDESEKN
ncbi:MAG: signal peptidase I [Candidatus Izemoplasmatales bacterium]|nr:signal peptidase I [Candidatus Izemoplasmatales bacterium]